MYFPFAGMLAGILFPEASNALPSRNGFHVMDAPARSARASIWVDAR